MSSMSTTMHVRPATGSDASDIARVGRSIFHETFAHSCSEKDMTAFLDSAYLPFAIATELENTQRSYLVAVADGQLAGFASLSFDSDERCVASYPDRVELQRIYVDSAHHGRGVAKALVDAIFDVAVSAGKEYIWLGVWEHNLRAKRFYAKLGFEKVGEHVFLVGDDEQTDWIVIRKL